MVTFTILITLLAIVFGAVLIYGTGILLIALDVCLGLLPFLLLYWIVAGFIKLFRRKS